MLDHQIKMLHSFGMNLTVFIQSRHFAAEIQTQKKQKKCPKLTVNESDHTAFIQFKWIFFFHHDYETHTHESHCQWEWERAENAEEEMDPLRRAHRQ